LPEKEFLQAKEILFWTMEMDNQGKLHEKLVQMPEIVLPVPVHEVSSNPYFGEQSVTDQK